MYRMKRIAQPGIIRGKYPTTYARIPKPFTLNSALLRSMSIKPVRPTDTPKPSLTSALEQCWKIITDYMKSKAISSLSANISREYLKAHPELLKQLIPLAIDILKIGKEIDPEFNKQLEKIVLLTKNNPTTATQVNAIQAWIALKIQGWRAFYDRKADDIAVAGIATIIFGTISSVIAIIICNALGINEDSDKVAGSPEARIYEDSEASIKKAQAVTPSPTSGTPSVPPSSVDISSEHIASPDSKSPHAIASPDTSAVKQLNFDESSEKQSWGQWAYSTVTSLGGYLGLSETRTSAGVENSTTKGDNNTPEH